MAKIKRFMAILLSALMILQALPVSAMAEEWNKVRSAPIKGVQAFEVKFLAEDGTQLVHQLVGGGFTPVEPDIPDVEGKRFVGWNDGENTYANLKSYAVTKNVNFTATYEILKKSSVVIHYVYTDGSMAIQDYVAEYEVGSNVDLSVETPTIAGFTADQPVVRFAGSMPETTQEFTVTYSGQDGITYTVKHLLQNIADNGYTEAESEQKTGKAGELTQAEALNELNGLDLAKGFTAQEPQQANIKADGSTVIEIKYDRKSFLLQVFTDGGTYVPGKMLRYGASLALPEASKMKKVGFTFDGWYYGDANGNITEPETRVESNATMPAADTNVVAKWKSNTTANYTVIYWQEKIPTDWTNTTDSTDYADGYDYKESVVRSGNVDANATYAEKSYAGFHRAHADTNVVIEPDGSTVLNVYYARDVKTITFYVRRNGRWRVDSSKTITAKVGADVSEKWLENCKDYSWETSPNSNTWYTLIANMPNSSFSVYADDNSGSMYIIYYVETLNSNEYKIYSKFENQSFTGLSTEDQQPIDGFTYSGWPRHGALQIPEAGRHALRSRAD